MDKKLFNAVDEKGKLYVPKIEVLGSTYFLTFEKNTLEGVKQLHVLPSLGKANAGDEGFFIVPRHPHMKGDLLVQFEQHEDTVYQYYKNGTVLSAVMSCYGIRTPELSALVRIERNYLYWFSIAVKDNIYSIETVFDFDDENPVYDDIRIEIIPMAFDVTLGDFAATERKLRLERGEIIPLAEKKQLDAVDYATKYPLIRIRMGWKQYPSPIKHQTQENEPEMHTVVTFARIRDIANSLKTHGVEGAELQLVGWNKSGHDGRYPQLMPPEEKLGGMQELKKTITYVKSLGYRISLHTNTVDSVELADLFTWEDILVKCDGSFCISGVYAGGESYYVCPEKQLKNAHRDFPEVAALGLNGLHYTDVTSITVPKPCFSDVHPCNRAHGIRLIQEQIKYTRELFGGFSSEGCMDYTLKHLDYGLYTTFGDAFFKEQLPVSFTYIPFFELTYHGVILYNPMSSTINYPLKHPKDQLVFWMRGGRPSFYFHSRYCYGTTNWMGEDDLIAADNESIDCAASLIAESAREYMQVAQLQTVYMKDYLIHNNGIEEAVYCNGTRIIGNFSDQTISFRGKTLNPWGWTIEEA